MIFNVIPCEKERYLNQSEGFGSHKHGGSTPYSIGLAPTTLTFKNIVKPLWLLVGYSEGLFCLSGGALDEISEKQRG